MELQNNLLYSKNFERRWQKKIVDENTTANRRFTSKVHDIKSVHQNDMQSACVTFLDMDIYQQARKELPPLQCDVLVHLPSQQLTYICGGGGQ